MNMILAFYPNFIRNRRLCFCCCRVGHVLLHFSFVVYVFIVSSHCFVFTLGCNGFMTYLMSRLSFDMQLVALVSTLLFLFTYLALLSYSLFVLTMVHAFCCSLSRCLLKGKLFLLLSGSKSVASSPIEKPQPIGTKTVGRVEPQPYKLRDQKTAFSLEHKTFGQERHVNLPPSLWRADQDPYVQSDSSLFPDGRSTNPYEAYNENGLFSSSLSEIFDRKCETAYSGTFINFIRAIDYTAVSLHHENHSLHLRKCIELYHTFHSMYCVCVCLEINRKE